MLSQRLRTNTRTTTSLGDLPEELVLKIASHMGISANPDVEKRLSYAPDELKLQNDNKDGSELNIVEKYFFEDPAKPMDPAVLNGITDLKNLTVSCKSLYKLLLPMLYARSGEEDDWYALRWACFHGSITTLEGALRGGASVDHEFATQEDHSAWLRYRRINSHVSGFPKELRQKTFKAGTPLLTAVYGEVLNPKNHQVVEWLLSHGADVNLKDYNWIAPLHVVARYGIRRHSTVELLLKYGADVSHPGPMGWTPLHLTCWAPRRTPDPIDHWVIGRQTQQSDEDEAMLPIAKMLVESGANLEAQTNSSGSSGSPEPTRSGLTPLEFALYCHNNTMVRFFREQESEPSNT